MEASTITNNLPSEAIKEFQELYYKHFGERLNLEEAKIKAEDFMTFYRTVHKPLKKAWISKRENKRRKQ